ncbi:MAG TPA: RebB family R body protein [Thermoanaerobaculia bacterium]|nr:RebB family R body protein [Thermoanaerobaculia bacterium]
MSNLTPVNSQIIDAVQTTKDFVIGQAPQQGPEAVLQLVSQAVGLAVANGSSYLQNILTIDTAVTGKALALMMANPSEVAQYAPVVAQAQAAVAQSIQNFQQVGEAAAAVLAKFSIS